MEELDNDANQDDSFSDEPKLSKKELKALKKKEEKMAAKAAAKEAKKAAKKAELDAAEVDPAINGVRTRFPIQSTYLML